MHTSTRQRKQGTYPPRRLRVTEPEALARDAVVLANASGPVFRGPGTTRLALTRCEGEAIIIAGTVRVQVVRVRSGGVRLAVEAPEAITVDREEVHERRWAARPAASAG